MAEAKDKAEPKTAAKKDEGPSLEDRVAALEKAVGGALGISLVEPDEEQAAKDAEIDAKAMADAQAEADKQAAAAAGE